MIRNSKIAFAFSLWTILLLTCAANAQVVFAGVGTPEMSATGC
jgi:hypothetical protein